MRTELIAEMLDKVDKLEDALARHFADKDVPMEIRQAVDAFEIARKRVVENEDIEAALDAKAADDEIERARLR